MVFDEVGEIDVRGEKINTAVKGFALKAYTLKTPLLMTTSDKWTETYYEEYNTPLTASGNRTVQGVARGALFPEVHPSWEKSSQDMIKFAAKGTIYYEDVEFNQINVQARSLLRIGEAIANAVDIYIYTTLTAATGTSGVVAASGEWNHATISNRDPIGDILIGIAAIEANHYKIKTNGYILMDNLDYSSLLRNSKVINNPSFKTADVVSNGMVGQICGMKIIVSETVGSGVSPADEVMLIMGQRAATWVGGKAMQTAIITDPGVNIKIKAWEVGQVQVTDPEALYTITGTQV